MFSSVRAAYNAAFNESHYQNFVNEIQAYSENRLDFRLCETPLFLTTELSDMLVVAADEVLSQCFLPDILQKCQNAVSHNHFVPNCDHHPQFVQIDFAICKDENGNFFPQLIELQGFPTVYAFQHLLDIATQNHLPIPKGFTTYYSGLDRDSFVTLFKKVLLGDESPEQTILLEIEPEKQKTRIDFFCTEKLTGVKTVCLTKIKKRGRKLYYVLEGKEIPVNRIYNRVIFDELYKKEDLKIEFDYREDVDVTWRNHPNWFFRISKYCLPLLKTHFAPKAMFLSEINEYPKDLDNFVLKPLFSFSGGGVVVDVIKEILDHVKDRQNHILQRKVEYAPLILCPDGTYTKAEVRMMYLWDEKPILVNNLARMSKGKLMGASYNKQTTWAGSGIAYHPI
ncbi:MAG: hypothetical protein SFU91_09005 [Chloroherpetonaceae bacterium]|nr:hypothetical protein [Chloroherpetonaceae bacterium]